jgi:hypothetical protein
MHIGLTMFPTDYSIQPHDLAREAEARGFESRAAGAQPHSNEPQIALARRSRAAEILL